MSHLLFFVSFLLLFSFSSNSQKRWDGGGGDGLWSNPLNWSGNTIPIFTDDVIFDNSTVLTKYTVKLPAGNNAVTVRTVFINPGTGDSIELVLPVANTAVPALTVSGPGYGMVINNRGTFRNLSGAASGTPVNVADSIMIKDGGRWVHNTARAHASNVQVLSALPGTDKGIFEFDAPNASTTLSLSGQTFGNLTLKAVAAGGSLNYTAVGTSRVRIRGDLEINPGVTLGLNFSDSVVVDGNYIQNGGTFNLGNSTRSVVLVINKNMAQASTGIITESGTGTQEILLKGNLLHLIDVKGSLQNQVMFTMSGPGKATLNAPLNLPYKLNLKNGIINSTAVNIVHLLSGCSIAADTLSNNSFVNGPIKKDGLSNGDFLFPVGFSGIIRWIRLKNATGNFTVEYIRSDPHSLGSEMGAGINHLSQREYWTIGGSTGSNNASVILSFNDPQSGGVTSLPSLRVARLLNGSWESAGNTAFGGSPGSNGWVSSVAASGFSAGDKYFALASVLGVENPLPLSTIIFRVSRSHRQLSFNWLVQQMADLSAFDLQESADNIHFRTIATTVAISGKTKYHYELPDMSILRGYFRVRALDVYGGEHFSRIVKMADLAGKLFEVSGNSIVSSVLHLYIISEKKTMIQIKLSDEYGVTRKIVSISVVEGITNTDISTDGLPSGLYQVFGISSTGRTNIFRFVKR
ncbi:MAG: hypothetical protein ABI415_04480 [Flavitalea sp.]